MRYLTLVALSLGFSCGSTALFGVEILRLDFENAADLTQDASGSAVVGAGTIAQAGAFGSITQSSDAQVGSSSASFSPADYKNGKFIEFDNTAFPHFSPDDSYSVSLWVKPTTMYLADGNGFRGIVAALAENNFATLDWQIDNGETVDGGAGDGSTTFSRFASDNGNINLVEGADLSPTQWTHVAVSYNELNRSLSLFVDGAFRGVNNNEAGSSLETFRVGANRGTNTIRVFEGLIDDVRVFDNANIFDDQARCGTQATSIFLEVCSM